jgi:tRNA threonylcarbamoyladenosine biosynthesis protein TsaE
MPLHVGKNEKSPRTDLTQKPMKWTTTSPLQTQDIAKEILRKLSDKNVILLQGELGSGKTTFTKGLAKALGITQNIKSPTYTYVNSYEIDFRDFSRQGREEKRSGFAVFSRLHHFDLYRLPENTKDFPELTEALEHPSNLIIIEWPERLQKPPIPNINIQFTRNQFGSHNITLKK